MSRPLNIETKESKKFTAARRLSDLAFHRLPRFDLQTEIHGLRLRWSVFSREFYYRLCSYFPSCAILSDTAAAMTSEIEVVWISPELCGEDRDLWLDPDPACRFREGRNELHAVQRDFIAVERENEVRLLADYNLEDGLSNFIRWVLPQRLLQSDRILLHSSAWKAGDGGVHICLGESGAGKTTAVSMVEKNLILGDDMNLLERVEGRWRVTPALVGQRIQSRELLGQSFPIKGFMILEKSRTNECLPVNPVQAFLPLASSFANLFWDRLSLEAVVRAQDLMKSILSENRFYRLQFNLAGDVWDYVEKQ